MSDNTTPPKNWNECAKMFLEELFNTGKASSVNSMQFRSFHLGRVTKVKLPSKGEAPRDIGHSMSMLLDTRKSNFERPYPVDTGRKLNAHKTFRRLPGRLLNVLCTSNLRPVSTGSIFFIFGSLWYFITKCDISVYHKMWQKFITKCVSVLITKCNSFIRNYNSYYKIRRFYYRMQQLL